jgi:Kef-type K+ transport system membrane component KefB
VGQLELISEIALAFIAFSIGSEFKVSYLKKVGITPVIIAIFEGLAATFFGNRSAGSFRF